MGIPGGSSKWDGYIGNITLEKTSRLEQIRKAWKFRGLDSVRQDLQQREINIDYLLVCGNGSLQDLFHPASQFTLIDLFGFCPRYDPNQPLIALYVEGFRPRFLRENLHFAMNIGYSGNNRHDKISDLRDYLEQRMLQQSEYNYTYRSRTEIK